MRDQGSMDDIIADEGTEGGVHAQRVVERGRLVAAQVTRQHS